MVHWGIGARAPIVLRLDPGLQRSSPVHLQCLLPTSQLRTAGYLPTLKQPA